MPNSNAPMGLISRRNAAGGLHNDALRTYRTDPTDATPIFIGDPVIKTGKVDIDGTPYATKATAGSTNRITGVCEGLTGPSGLGSQGNNPRYRAASTDMYILVSDDPDVLYEIQESGNFGVNMAGKNANLTFATAGVAATGRSGAQIDSASPATGATLQLKVISAEHRVDWVPGTTSTAGTGQNDPTAANCKWLVKINLHTEAPGQAGV